MALSQYEYATRAMIVCVALFIVLFDVVIIQLGGKQASVSVVAFNWACQNPILTLAMGVVLGHIYWPN